jgi:excisionase family DNA binding protein
MTTTQLLSAGEAAAILGCSVRTVHRRIARGDLPVAYRLPGNIGAYVLRRDDVDRAAQRQLDHDRREHPVNA